MLQILPYVCVFINLFVNVIFLKIFIFFVKLFNNSIFTYKGVDGWSSPLKQSIYSFVILLPDRKQYIYSIEDYSSHSHTSDFNAEKIIHILEQVGPSKFTAIVTDAEAAMMAAKRIVTSTFPNILSIRCIAHHIQLIASDIVKINWAKNTLQNIQKIITFF